MRFRRCGQKLAEDFGFKPRLSLSEYRFECGELICVGRFGAMEVDVENFVMYDRNNSQRDTALGAWKRREALL